MSSILELQQLSKRYGRRQGIEEISLAMQAGESFGLVGPRGAGKTTTVRTLMGLISASSGYALLFGLDSRKKGATARKRIGYIPAEPHFYGPMRVKQLLTYSASFYGRQSTKRLKDLAEYFELDLKHRIEDLSFSGKKKVAIIQALAHNPELIIADEPSWGLSPIMQQKLLLILRERQEQGVAIFYATDILGEVQNLCDRLAYLQDGRLINIIDVELLRQNPFKKVRATATETLPPLNLPGLSEVQIAGPNLEFLYQGNIKQLLQILYNLPLHNIYIEEPNLEDVFRQLNSTAQAPALSTSATSQISSSNPPQFWTDQPRPTAVEKPPAPEPNPDLELEEMIRKFQTEPETATLPAATAEEPPTASETTAEDSPPQEQPATSEAATEDNPPQEPPTASEAATEDSPPQEPPATSETAADDDQPQKQPTTNETAADDDQPQEQPATSETAAEDNPPQEPPAASETATEDTSPQEPPAASETATEDTPPQEPPATSETEAVQEAEQPPAEPQQRNLAAELTAPEPKPEVEPASADEPQQEPEKKVNQHD